MQPQQQSLSKTNLSCLQRVFGCDLRSLALFRIGFAIMIIADLLLRSSAMEAMYTDEGLFNLAQMQEYADATSHTKDAMAWSVHAFSGSLAWQVAMFLIAGVAAIMLLVGYKTRWATVVCWIMVASIQARNPFILTSGDTLLKLLLFWSMFLPLGAVWSIDAIRRFHAGKETGLPASRTYLSFASAGIILQLLMMYFFTGVAKWNDYWFSGLAMEYVLRLDLYATEFGKYLLNYEGLLYFICWATVLSEVFLPLLLLLPWQNDRIRLASIAVFWGLHLGIALTMTIGLFSYISMIAWLLMLPSSFWESRLVSGLLKKLSVPSVRLRAPVPTHWSLTRIATIILCAFFILYFLCWNISNIDNAICRKFMPASMYFVSKYTNSKQEFRMFNIPPLQSPWFVYEAKLVDGSRKDILRDAPASHERPESVRSTIPGHHWRRLHRRLAMHPYESLRESTAKYLMRRWNKEHPKREQIVYLQQTAYLDEIGPNYNGTDQIKQVWGRFGKVDEMLFDEAFEKALGDGDIFP